jgi:ketosteroid isomerase-like protein
MKRYILVLLILILSVPLFAQEWSSAQKEVWSNVETYWDLWAKRDVDGFLSYLHDDYSGWFYGAALPSTKSSSRKWLSDNFKAWEILVYEVNPAAIKIHGDVAIVHYFYSAMRKNKEGKRSGQSGRWTDILLKQGDKWILIGDHGGSKEN